MAREVILNFHGIGEPGPDIETGERPYWLPPETLEAILARIAAAHPPHALRVTFDDGNLSDLEVAAPLLARHGLGATFFVLAGRIGTPGYLGAEHMAELRRQGFAVGTHGAAHLDWRGLDDAGLRAEIHDARAAIADALGEEVGEAGIPFGLYNRRVVAALRAEGYRAVYTSDRGFAGTGAWLRPRNTLQRGMSMDAIDAIIAGRWPLPWRLRKAATIFLKSNVV